MAIDLSRDGYTHEQVRDLLHMRQGSRRVRFRYFLLDKNENEKGELKTVESASIEQSAFSDIKRTAKIRLKDDTDDIDWNSDRIQIFIEYRIPDWMEQHEVENWYFITPVFGTTDKQIEFTKREGGWIAFSLGIFLLSTPTRVEEGRNVYRDVECYDKLLIVKEDLVTDRYTIGKGTNYYNAMWLILLSAGVGKFNIEDSGKALPNDKEYDPGTSKLEILNDLASDINFTPFWVDEYGYFRSNTYQSPSTQSPDYEYQDDDMSVVEAGMEEELDLFGLPNVWTVVVSNPDNDSVLTSTVENHNPDHPRSIENLGRRVVRYEEKDNIADQAALDAYTERLATEATEIYGHIKFSTAIMPFHSYSNVLQIRNQTLGINDKYSETKWSMNLESGGSMEHECRRVVSLV